MARKKEINKDNDVNIPDMPVIDQSVVDTLELNYMPYAMSVIISRAIPEIDGFKPSHRKLLYTMYKMGLLNGERTKSSNVVGQTMKLNPHGDQAIYDTMVRLARNNESLLHPFVDSKGNFGKHYSSDIKCAAPRYTEVRLEKICEELFKSIDKNAVMMVDNFDGKVKEPMLLPTTYPNILVNANTGIAVGMASNIPSFNLKEVCDAVIAYIDNPDVDLLEIMPAPDFVGGGEIIYNKEQMRAIYESGKGSFAVRSTYEYVKNGNLIEIKEIPYSTTSEAIINKVVDLVKEGKVKEISDIRDETDKFGLKIAIELKRGVDPDEVMTKLFRFTTLQDSFSCNFNMLIDGSPKVLGIKGIIEEWLKWRRQCVLNELNFDLDKLTKQLHLLEGLAKILLDIDKAIEIIRNTELEEDVVPNLIKGFSIDEVQAEYVAEIKLRNINKQYILRRIEDRTKIADKIKELQDTIKSPKKIDKLIVDTLNKVSSKYSMERKSKLVFEEETQKFDIVESIPDYKIRVMLTEHGYFRKHTLTSLRSAGVLKIKDDDKITVDLESNNKSEILFFSSKGNVYKCKAYDFNEIKPSELGYYLSNELQLEDDERIIHMIATDDFKGNLMIAFENGKIALFPLSVYETKQNRRKLLNAFFAGSKAVTFKLLEEDREVDIVAKSSLNKAVVFKSSLVPLKKTKTTQGVQILVSKKGSLMTEIALLEEDGLNEPDYYRIRNIPAIGYYLKDNAYEDKQITFDGMENT